MIRDNKQAQAVSGNLKTIFKILLFMLAHVWGAVTVILRFLAKSHQFPIINPTTDAFFSYSGSQHAQTQGLYAAFLGVEHPISTILLLQTGLGYYQTGTFTSTGILTQGADVQSQDVYTYQYKLLTRQLLVEGKLMYTYREKFHPYLTAGIGPSFNTASDFSTSAPPFLTFTRAYQGATNTSFAYLAGIGVDTQVTPKIRLGAGYRFAGLGGFSFGYASIDNQRVSKTISQSTVNTNEVLAQLTYII